MVNRSEAGGSIFDALLDHDVGELDTGQGLEAAIVVVGDLHHDAGCASSSSSAASPVNGAFGPSAISTGVVVPVSIEASSFST